MPEMVSMMTPALRRQLAEQKDPAAAGDDHADEREWDDAFDDSERLLHDKKIPRSA
jgi:hypothetical protein